MPRRRAAPVAIRAGPWPEKSPRSLERAGGRRVWLVTTNDNLEALRFYQRRGFRLAQLRCGAVDEARRHLKPAIPASGFFGIPVHDEIVLEQEHATAP